MKTLGAYPSPNGPTFSVDFKNLDEELQFLRRVVTQYRETPKIRELAINIVRDGGAPPRDKKAQAIEIAKWVQDNILYIHELPERFQLPDETLRLRAGDCDDFTTLICSLCESIGIPSVPVCMSVDGNWSHIFAGAWMKGGKLLPLDATMQKPMHEIPNPIAAANAAQKKVSLKLA